MNLPTFFRLRSACLASNSLLLVTSLATAQLSLAEERQTGASAAAEASSPSISEADLDAVAERYSDVEVVDVIGRKERLDRVSTQKLLKVPGAGNDPLQAIQSLPGVVFNANADSEPAVRGSSPEDNAYYIDFFPVGYIFHMDSSSILNDNVVSDFTLEASAFGPEYNDATGAVIDASSRSPDFGEGKTVIDLSFLKAGLFIERPLGDNQGAYFSVRQSLFQYYIETFLDDEDFEFTTVPEYYDYQGKYEYEISATENLVVQAVGARDKGGLLFDDDSDAVLQDPGLAGGLNFEQYFNSQGVLWEKIYNNGLIQKVGLSQLEQKFQFGIGETASIDVKSNDYILRSLFTLPLNLDHELDFGVEYSQEHVAYKGFYSGPRCDEFDPDCRLVDGDELITGSGKPVINTTNIHVADQWQMTEAFSIKPGVLYSYDDYTKETFVEPKFDSRLEFASYWALTFGYGKYHIFPDDFGQFVEDFGNPDLKLPRATHWASGIEYQLQDDLLVKLDAYYKELDKLIIGLEDQEYYPELTDEEYDALPLYTNDAEGKAWGFELFVNKDLTDRWYGWASLAWSRTQRTNNITGEDFRFAYDQPIIINSVASYQWNDNWTLGMKWRYQSGQLITPLLGAEQDDENPDLYNPIYGELNSERLPAYHKMDVRADRSFFFERWEMDLYFEVLNLYGRKNVVDYEYKNADYSEREDVTDLPTIVSVGVKATF